MNYDTIYRIYTEAEASQGFSDILGDRFQGYTVYYTMGSWEGSREQSIVIEIWSEGDAMFTAVQSAANAIKEANNQDSVCVTVTRATFLQF